MKTVLDSLLAISIIVLIGWVYYLVNKPFPNENIDAPKAELILVAETESCKLYRVVDHSFDPSIPTVYWSVCNSDKNNSSLK